MRAAASAAPTYNPHVDFKFRYNRRRPSPSEQAREKREEADLVRRTRGLAVGTTIPFALASGPVTGWLVGGWLDRKYDTSFWLITLILLGTVAGLTMTIRLLSRLSSK
jgi:F0F1-type ATP synthase assembly protein I